MLSSCTIIYFSETQPKGWQQKQEVPKELYGKWFDKTEGWEIGKNGLTTINIKTDSIGNITDTTYRTTSAVTHK